MTQYNQVRSTVSPIHLNLSYTYHIHPEIQLSARAGRSRYQPNPATTTSTFARVIIRRGGWQVCWNRYAFNINSQLQVTSKPLKFFKVASHPRWIAWESQVNMSVLNDLVNIATVWFLIPLHSIIHTLHSDVKERASRYLSFQHKFRVAISFHPSRIPSCLSCRLLPHWPLPSWLTGIGSTIEMPHSIQSIPC